MDVPLDLQVQCKRRAICSVLLHSLNIKKLENATPQMPIENHCRVSTGKQAGWLHMPFAAAHLDNFAYI